MRVRTSMDNNQKRQSFRLEIRRKQIQNLLSISRHELPNLSLTEAKKKIQQNVKQLSEIMVDRTITLFNNRRMQIILKELRDINCSFIAPQQFARFNTISVLLQLQNSTRLDCVSQVFIHEIVLNVTADTTKYDPNSPKKGSIRQEGQLLRQKGTGRNRSYIDIKQLRLGENIKQVHSQLYPLSIKIMGNLLQQDLSGNTIYHVITKLKMYREMLMLLIQKKELYQLTKVEPIFMWFGNKLIKKTMAFQFQNLDHDFSNFVNCVFVRLVEIFKSYDRKEFEWDGKIGISINQIFLYFKNLLKTQLIQLQQDLISKIQAHFSVNNLYYIDFLSSLISRTLYSLPLNHFQEILRTLLTYPSNQYSPILLRCIANSMVNDPSHYKLVLNTFIQYSTHTPLPKQSHLSENQMVDYESYGLLSYFMHFLNCSESERDMAEIIGILICCQGGLGIFEQGVEYLAESREVAKRLQNLGFEVY